MDIEKLYQDYFLVVYKYILSISHDPLAAEEITQDTFFKALKKLMISVEIPISGCGCARLLRIHTSTM